MKGCPPSAIMSWILSMLMLLRVRANILEDWISPLSPDAFFDATFEQQWAHFPHNHSLVPITLGHVAEWLQSQGREVEVIETLRHPVSKQGFRASKPSLNPVQYIQEAFLQGHSMVINSLNKWSEPGARLAKELHKACDLPIDVYMYLTPPYSQSYGFHSDVMDAFMVQLAGSKLWKLCDVPSWMSLSEDENDPKKLNASCEEIQMKGGDVMYVPYGTLHQASTSSDFSMHLTVNIERQYYVWLAVIFAMMHKAVEPKLSIEGFLNAFAPDDMDIPAVRSIYKLSPKIPMLHRLPGASQTFLVSLCNEDLPGGHLEKLKAELEDLIGNILNVLSSDSKVATSVPINGRKVSFLKIMTKLQKRSHELLEWALQLTRYHAIRHGKEQLQHGHESLFHSLSAARRLQPEVFNKKQTLSSFPSLLPPDTLIRRRLGLRAVLLTEADSAKLVVDSEVILLKYSEIPTTILCLGLYAEGSLQGRPFTLGDILSQSAAPSDHKQLLHRLLLSGALELVS
ncbi:unnamed protein product [Durusdinium trenchii]|uniref:Bifunctional lysine-specific demethylase and histidyl-hydroxylase n=1 Tax=Durusdinium trenchii TaxID=1381693 RepID=A0ABP0HQ16_9DINO